MWATTKWEAALYREWSRRRKGTDAAERSGEVQLQAMWSEAAGDHQWLALTTPHAAHTKLGKHDASNEVRSAVAQQVYVLRHAGAGTAHAGNNNNTVTRPQ